MYLGIPQKDYDIGDIVEYLGYDWYVMKNNPSSVQLVMLGFLTTDELNENMPTDTQTVSTNDSMRMCTSASEIGNYCNDNGSAFSKYTWNKSIIKPTVENWLESKMTENGLTKEKELNIMSFNDGVEIINSYVRIPTKDDLSDILCVNSYCSLDKYMFTNYSYWTLTFVDASINSSFIYANIYGSSGGGIFRSFTNSFYKVRPVITVNKS